ncbi:MAG: peroxiredoxin-like family protein [Phycisphaerales bacterium JB040]
MITTRKNFLAACAAVLCTSGLAVAQDEMSEPVTATAATVKNLEPKTGLPVGWIAPGVELKDKDGKAVKLSELYAKGPTVVAFYRGGWCPFCVRQLRDWREYESEFEAAGVNLVFITPEAVENVASSVEKTETPYTVLSDTEQKAASLFNVIFQLDDQTRQRYKGYGIDLNAWNANSEWSLPVPGVFVIDTEGAVRWTYINENYQERADVEEVLEAAAALN